MNDRNLIPRIGGHHAGIPYKVAEGSEQPPLRLTYEVWESIVLFGASAKEKQVHHYTLKTTVRWDDQINFRYEQEYVYAGRWPPKKTDVA
jgi:hypothetical protein